MKRYYRSGITLAETLVVVSMVGILVGIAMPALQNLREASRSIECQQRLGVLNQGSLQYQESFNRMPPVTTSTGPVEDADQAGLLADVHQHTGAIAYILPFIGFQELFDLMPAIATDLDQNLEASEFATFSSGGVNSLLGDANFRSAYSEQVDSWICPSNALYLDALVEFLAFWSPVQLTNQNENVWHQLFVFPNLNSTAFGRSSYVPTLGGFNTPFSSEERAIDLNLGQVFGAMRNRADSIRTDELLDGASNTACWTESVGWIDSFDQTPSGKPELIGANFALFGNAVITGRNFLVNGFNEPPTLFGSAEGSTNFVPGSMHPDGVPFAMCDGSVRMINRNTSRQVMAALGCGGDSWILARE